jgi:hypothetical protein
MQYLARLMKVGEFGRGALVGAGVGTGVGTFEHIHGSVSINVSQQRQGTMCQHQCVRIPTPGRGLNLSCSNVHKKCHKHKMPRWLDIATKAFVRAQAKPTLDVRHVRIWKIQLTCVGAGVGACVGADVGTGVGALVGAFKAIYNIISTEKSALPVVRAVAS